MSERALSLVRGLDDIDEILEAIEGNIWQYKYVVGQEIQESRYTCRRLTVKNQGSREALHQNQQNHQHHEGPS